MALLAPFRNDSSFNWGTMRQLHLRQVSNPRICRVTRRYPRCLNRPLDAHIRVVPKKPAFVVGIVKSARLVVQVRPVAQNAESMGKTRRHIQLSRTAVAQLHAKTLTEGGRCSPQIDRDIEHTPPHYGNDLRLGSLHLKVQAAQHALGGARLIVLNKMIQYPRFPVTC